MSWRFVLAVTWAASIGTMRGTLCWCIISLFRAWASVTDTGSGVVLSDGSPGMHGWGFQLHVAFLGSLSEFRWQIVPRLEQAF